MPRLIPINTPDGTGYLYGGGTGQWLSMADMGAAIPDGAQAVRLQAWEDCRYCFAADAAANGIQGMPLANGATLELFEQGQMLGLRILDAPYPFLTAQYYRIA